MFLITSPLNRFGIKHPDLFFMQMQFLILYNFFMKKLFLKSRYLLLAIVMLIACYVYVYFVGNEYTCIIDTGSEFSGGADTVVNIDDNGLNTLEVTYSRFEGNTAYVGVRSRNPGRAYLSVKSGEDSSPVSS